MDVVFWENVHLHAGSGCFGAEIFYCVKVIVCFCNRDVKDGKSSHSESAQQFNHGAFDHGWCVVLENNNGMNQVLIARWVAYLQGRIDRQEFESRPAARVKI